MTKITEIEFLDWPSKRGIIDPDSYDIQFPREKKFNGFEFLAGTLVVIFFVIAGAWILP